MIPFTKVNGNGNDFILFEAAKCPSTIRDAGFIQRLCDRHKGVGGDGMLVISDSSDSEVAFHLDYHNSDGSWETFCANGTRCAVQYFGRMQREPKAFCVTTGAGKHRAEILDDGLVRLQILAPSHVTDMLEISTVSGQHVDSGAPHFAAQVEDLTDALVAEVGPEIRYADIFQPRGVNVNLYQRVDQHTIKVITYEKGVEAVVLSCASGSTAAAFQAAHTNKMLSPIRIINPGGELVVAFDDDWQDVSVTGPAVLVYSSELPDDF